MQLAAFPLAASVKDRGSFDREGKMLKGAKFQYVEYKGKSQTGYAVHLRYARVIPFIRLIRRCNSL